MNITVRASIIKGSDLGAGYTRLYKPFINPQTTKS